MGKQCFDVILGYSRAFKMREKNLGLHHPLGRSDIKERSSSDHFKSYVSDGCFDS